ncbi:MAG: DUF4115 domain-containing protein [Peptococcaceae bacterium]|nr:DUF4115 domain-containing protein [Peptococcaceae bacterium]
MRELGSRISSARKEQGLSIEDLHVRSKIRPRSIEAIEKGNFEAIAGGNVYIKGFIRTLAEELGLDYNELIEMWEPVVVPPTVHNPRSSYRPSVFPFIGAVVMVLALVAAGVYYLYLRPQPQLPPVTPPQVNKPPVVEEPKPTIPDVAPPAFVYVGEQGDREVYEVTSWPLELVVRVKTGNCWVQVVADNLSSEVTLTAPQERLFTATDDLRMRLGRANVVEILLNGEALPRQTGDVRNYTFKKPGP